MKYCAVILIAIFAVVKSDEVCNPQEAMQCIEGYSPPSLAPLNDSFPDAEFLDENCGPAITTLECLNKVVENCPSFVEALGSSVSILTGSLELLHSVCDADSELRKGYLDNVECYNTAMPAMNECEERITRIAHDFFDSVKNDTDIDEWMDPFCLVIEEVFACAIAESTVLCGKDETDPLKAILEDMTSLAMQAACPEEKLLVWQLRFALYLLENEIEEFKK